MLRRCSSLLKGGTPIRRIADDAPTLLTEHARRLHTSSAALDKSLPPLGAAASQPPPSQGAADAPASDVAAAAAGAALPSLRDGWAAVPSVTKTLGLAGVIPFIALSPPVAAHLPYLGSMPELLDSVALLQLGYGATIASFLGGSHWGAAMLDFRPGAQKANIERYIWGVMPCLMAWPAVVMPSGPGALAVATTLGIAHIVDRTFTRRGLMPPWYMSLRLPLTTMAISGLLITVGADILTEQQHVEALGKVAEESSRD